MVGEVIKEKTFEDMLNILDNYLIQCEEEKTRQNNITQQSRRRIKKSTAVVE